MLAEFLHDAYFSKILYIKKNHIKNYMKLRIKQVITIILTLIIISLLIFYVGFEEIIASFQKIPPLSLILFYILFGLTYALRSIGWKEIFQISKRDVKFSNIFYASGICLFSNEFIPFKMGDLIRIEIITKKEEVPYGMSVSTLALLRTFELLSMVLISFLTIIILYFSGIQAENDIIRNILIIGLFLVTILIVILMLIGIKGEFMIKIVTKLPEKIANSLIKLVLSIQESLSLIISSKLKIMKPFLIISLGIFIDGSVMYILSTSLNLEINYLIILLTTLIMYISSVIPFLPGGWGLSEVVGSTVLNIFYPSIDMSLLLTLVIIDHLIRLVYSIFYGGFSIIKIDYKWSKTSKIKKNKLKNGV